MEIRGIPLGCEMAIKKIELENITVFDKMNIEFTEGVNIFIGENGVGKTHVMKLLYSACQAVKHDVSFSQKTVRVFRPDGSSIQRLVSRKNKGGTASVKVFSDTSNISMKFTTRTKKWDADVKNEERWEQQLSDLSSIFIPAKEILSNAYNLTEAVLKGNVDFDDTYLDIIASAKVNVSPGKDSVERKKYLDVLQKISDGKVAVDNERFYLKPGSQAKIEFHLVAEGLRKIALLWQLIKNGTLERGAVLFWDEPEANINPIHIPVIVELLLLLQREGVQIFVSTHDYFVAKYFDVRKTEADNIKFHSFYREDKNVILCEGKETFADLEHNTIMKTFMDLYHEEIGLAVN